MEIVLMKDNAIIPRRASKRSAGLDPLVLMLILKLIQ